MLGKSLLVNAFFLLYSLSSFAQDMKESIQKIQDRTLLVILESPLESVIKKLKPEEVTNYEKAIENYNRKLKEVTDKFWTFTDKKEFKTWNEVAQLF